MNPEPNIQITHNGQQYEVDVRCHRFAIWRRVHKDTPHRIGVSEETGWWISDLMIFEDEDKEMFQALSHTKKLSQAQRLSILLEYRHVLPVIERYLNL